MTSVFYNPPQGMCDPAPPRCRARHRLPFHPPISWRRIPLCRPPNCEDIQEGDPNLHVNRQATLDRVDWIRGWVITQLFTRGQVECDETPPYMARNLRGGFSHPRLGGWWADAFRSGGASTERGQGFRTGSRLWALQWNHVNNQTLIQAKEAAFEAIGYLLSWGIASKIEVNPWYISRRVMRLDISIRGPGVSTTVSVQGQAMPDSRYLWTEYSNTPNVDSLGKRYPRSVPTGEAHPPDLQVA